MQCIRVDLPEPEGPMIALKRPVSKATSTPSMARTAFSPSPYTFVAPTVLAAAPMAAAGGAVTTFDFVMHVSFDERDPSTLVAASGAP